MSGPESWRDNFVTRQMLVDKSYQHRFRHLTSSGTVTPCQMLSIIITIIDRIFIIPASFQLWHAGNTPGTLRVDNEERESRVLG